MHDDGSQSCLPRSDNTALFRSHTDLIFHNFPWPILIFQVLQPCFIKILKLHDFPGFPWPERTLPFPPLPFPLMVTLGLTWKKKASPTLGSSLWRLHSWVLVWCLYLRTETCHRVIIILSMKNTPPLRNPKIVLFTSLRQTLSTHLWIFLTVLI